jgi:hypothetical protein
MTTLTKCKFAWKYRKPLWKYRKLIKRRRELAAAALMAGIGAGVFFNRHRLEWLSGRG